MTPLYVHVSGCWKALVLHSSVCLSVSSEVQGTDECAHHLRLVASSSALPPQYWLTLQSLLRHFSRVCQASAANLLSARALAEIFSPTLFRHQPTRYILTHMLMNHVVAS